MSKRSSKSNPTHKRGAVSGAPKPPEPFQRVPLLARRKLLAGVALVALLVSGALAVLVRNHSSATKGAVSSRFTVGSVDYCQNRPRFIELFGFPPASALDTRAKYVKGLALREMDANGSILRSYIHPTWSRAGYLGAFQRDDLGNIFIIPAPFISVLENAPEKANIVYRIDSVTGVMSPLVNLPILAPPTPQNPFGLLNIAYDCDTHTLYATSVFGSTYEHMAGCIFQIDPLTGSVQSSLEGFDAMGVSVFNTAEGKRLYFGSARSPDIYSVALDEKGGFTRDLRAEVSLTEVENYSDERALSIAFAGQNQMEVKTIQFDFNLVAPTETHQKLLNYTYNSDQRKWKLAAIQIINE